MLPKYWCSIYRDGVQDSHRALVLRPNSRNGAGDGYLARGLAAPYYVFQDSGAQVDLASIAGGRAPIDPTSVEPAFQTEATRRFADDLHAQRALANTSQLASIKPEIYDAVFYSGGLGPVFDLSEDPVSIAFIEAMHRAGKPIAAVCHGPAVLRNVRDARGFSLVKDREVTGFSNSEEMAANGPGVVPFFIEDTAAPVGRSIQRRRRRTAARGRGLGRSSPDRIRRLRKGPPERFWRCCGGGAKATVDVSLTSTNSHSTGLSKNPTLPTFPCWPLPTISPTLLMSDAAASFQPMASPPRSLFKSRKPDFSSHTNARLASELRPRNRPRCRNR